MANIDLRTATGAAPLKETFSDADRLNLYEYPGWIFKAVSGAGLKATLKTYFDTLYGSGDGTVTAVTGGTGLSSTEGTTPAISHDAHTGHVTGATDLTIENGVVTVAMLADATIGNLISFGPGGVSALVATGTNGQVLTSNGPGSAPTMSAATAGTVTAVTGGTGLSSTGGTTPAVSHDSHTGEVTGSTALTITAKAVTLAKMDDISQGSIIVGGAADAPTALDAKTTTQILVGDGTDLKSVALSNDVTMANTGAVTLANKAVTLAKMDDIATASLMGRSTAATGVPEVLSKATVKTLLGFIESVEGDTTPQLGGDLEYNENNQVFDSTLTSSGTAAGDIITVTFGESVIFGDVCYPNATDNEWKKALGTNAATTTPAMGMALETKADGAAGKLLLRGTVRDDTIFSGSGAGDTVYLSDATAGDVVYAAPDTTGDIVQILGFGIAANYIFFDPDNTSIEVA